MVQSPGTTASRLTVLLLAFPLALGLGSCGAPSAGTGPGAQPFPNMYRRGEVRAGAALLDNFDTTAQVSGDAGAGAIIDLEDLLGVDDDTQVAQLGANWKFSPRHQADIGVFDIERNGTRDVGSDIQIGNVVIPSGTVKTQFDTLVVKAAYRYNFVAEARTAIGASFGLHTLGIDLALESKDFSVSESFRATAPMPVLGLHGEYALSERWKLLASFEVFQIDIGYFEGYLADNRLALENDLFEHFGWGVALNGFQLDAQLEEGSLEADIEYAYQGLLVYLRAYF